MVATTETGTRKIPHDEFVLAYTTVPYLPYKFSLILLRWFRLTPTTREIRKWREYGRHLIIRSYSGTSKTFSWRETYDWMTNRGLLTTPIGYWRRSYPKVLKMTRLFCHEKNGGLYWFIWQSRGSVFEQSHLSISLSNDEKHAIDLCQTLPGIANH